MLIKYKLNDVKEFNEVCDESCGILYNLIKR